MRSWLVWGNERGVTGRIVSGLFVLREVGGVLRHTQQFKFSFKGGEDTAQKVDSVFQFGFALVDFLVAGGAGDDVDLHAIIIRVFKKLLNEIKLVFALFFFLNQFLDEGVELLALEPGFFVGVLVSLLRLMLALELMQALQSLLARATHRSDP